MDYNRMILDLIEAKECDEKYKRENDAKFRAVEQKVQSYNEFEAIVKGCHLRPLDKKESMTNVTSSASLWNPSASEKKKYDSLFDKEVAKYFAPRQTTAVTKDGLTTNSDLKSSLLGDANQASPLDSSIIENEIERYSATVRRDKEE